MWRDDKSAASIKENLLDSLPTQIQPKRCAILDLPKAKRRKRETELQKRWRRERAAAEREEKRKTSDREMR